jgi:predicted nucleotidyltransferase
MFGLAQNDYVFICQTLEPLLKRNIPIYCFGSRARGDNYEFSDLDLMIESKNDLSNELVFIKEELELSELPIKVDLIQRSEFADNYLSNYTMDKVRFL